MTVRRVLSAAILLIFGACAAPPAPTLGTRSPGPTPKDGQFELPSMGRDVTETAREYLGYDYLYGGTGDGGFDCSGLVSTVFAQHGLQLPRSSTQQYSWGQPVAAGDLREGDLVFFANEEGRINHVGIWSGQGRFIHASSSRGVVEDSSASAWFRDHFVGGRRVGIVPHEERSERRSKPVGS